MLEDLDNAVVVVQQNEFNSKRYKLVSDQTIIKEVVQAAKKVRLKNFYATCKETKKIDIETYGI